MYWAVMLPFKLTAGLCAISLQVCMVFVTATAPSGSFDLLVNQSRQSIINERAPGDCVDPDPDNTLTDRLNIALNSSGPGYLLQLCPGREYVITAPVKFAFPDQEISTVGYPTGDARAVLTVLGPVENGQGHTTAVDGTCQNCDGVKLRNVQINGTRHGGVPINGGGNIEMGGDNSNQLVEYVHSFDPRGWTCLHVAEGPLTCNNVTVRNNDIGPCGSDAFQQWADGISFSCRNGIVRNNLINNPTDGGIVLFGAPGTLVENNTIWVETHTLLGGINMVDYDPFSGDYTGTTVQYNVVVGGFATGSPSSNGGSRGGNKDDVIVKIGIAIGPRTWFGGKFGSNSSKSGIVRNNQFTGAFGYGIALTSATNFTVENNALVGNTSFIGSRGPNCSSTDTTPAPAPFVMDQANVLSSTTQLDFQIIPDGDGLTCILPPDGGDWWPFGGNPSHDFNSTHPPVSPPEANPSSKLSSSGRTIGLVVGLLGGILLSAVVAWFLRRWALFRNDRQHDYRMSIRGYIKENETKE